MATRASSLLAVVVVWGQPILPIRSFLPVVCGEGQVNGVLIDAVTKTWCARLLICVLGGKMNSDDDSDLIGSNGPMHGRGYALLITTRHSIVQQCTPYTVLVSLGVRRTPYVGTSGSTHIGESQDTCQSANQRTGRAGCYGDARAGWGPHRADDWLRHWAFQMRLGIQSTCTINTALLVFDRQVAVCAAAACSAVCKLLQ